MSAKLNLIGRTFGRSIVIEEAEDAIGPNGKHHRRSVLRCQCGTIFIARNTHLVSGHTQSCNCLSREKARARLFKHGHKTVLIRTQAYIVWVNMIQRCTNPKVTRFKNHGGRGITVCERWRNSFSDFLADFGPGKKGWTIERVDNDLGYELENAVWATRTRQARNRRTNRIVTVNGVTACLMEHCEKYGLNYGTVRHRLKRGWSVERAFNQGCP